MAHLDHSAGWHRGCTAIFIVSLVLLTTVCQAQSDAAPGSAPAPAPGRSIWLAASDQTLDQMRGGFDLGSGLLVSFGISRALSINGQLITSTSLNLGELARLTPMQAAALGQQMAAQTQVVQNGSGNTFTPTGPAAAPASLPAASPVTLPMATVIQNTLNHQTIRNLTIIEATSNAMGLVKGLNLRATIDDAISNALANR
jgi:hypothetical protein